MAAVADRGPASARRLQRTISKFRAKFPTSSFSSTNLPIWCGQRYAAVRWIWRKVSQTLLPRHM